MKWFLALTADSPGLPLYADLLRVALHSAAAHAPALRPHLLFDGPLPDWPWLERYGVEVIPRRTFLYDRLTDLAARTADPTVLSIGAGTFLRLELPALAAERGWADERVLYTDMDLLFTADPLPLLNRLAPPRFAAAPEDRHDRLSLNAGVMLLNLPGLAKDDPAFRRYVSDHLPHFCHRAREQEAYRTYYATRLLPDPAADEKLVRFTRLVRRHRWTDLPLELNWRPYWGANPAAAIIHFHGPKPQQAPYFRLPPADRPPELAGVGHLATDHYFALTAGWLAAKSDADS